jgi:hypothetical protein
MKDLYGRLNVPPYASTDAIRTALERAADPTLKSDVEAVLLNPQHRAAYDRAHRLLTAVGMLRRRTNLHLRPFWARSGNQDFSGALPSGEIGSQDAEPQKSHAMRRALIISLFIVLITAAWVLWERL